MAKVYDSAELLRMAAEMQSMSEELNHSLRETVKWMSSDIVDHFSGVAADELDKTINDMYVQLSGNEKEMNNLGLALKRYAYLLEDADEKARKEIQTK